MILVPAPHVSIVDDPVEGAAEGLYFYFRGLVSCAGRLNLDMFEGGGSGAERCGGQAWSCRKV